MEAVQRKTFLSSVAWDAKKLRQVSVIALATGVVIATGLTFFSGSEPSEAPQVQSLSRLTFLQTLVGNLKAVPAMPTAKKQAVLPPTALSSKELRGQFALDFENLKFEMREIGLADSKEWKDFAAAWQKSKSTNDIASIQALLSEPTFALAQRVVLQAMESKEEATRYGRIFFWLAAVSSIAIGYFALRRVEALHFLTKSSENQENEIVIEPEEKVHPLRIVQTAMSEPIAQLARKTKLALECVAFAEKTLASPVEATLFENPQHYEKAEASLQKVRDAQVVLKDILETETWLNSVSEELSAFNFDAFQKQTAEIDIADIVGEHVAGVTAELEDAELAVESVLRSDAPVGLANKEALHVVISNLIFNSVATLKVTKNIDRHLLVSVWQAHAFWEKFDASETMPASLYEKLFKQSSLRKLETGAVMVFADTAEKAEGDLLESFFEQGEFESESNSGHSLRLRFVREILVNNQAFAWLSRSEIEPGFFSRQLVVFWPF